MDEVAGARTLTARSVLASALLGEDPPELPVGHLVRLAGLFGISPNRARVALHRMVSAGEATTDGTGRYRLAGHLMARRERQNASRRGHTGRWTGDWVLVAVTAGPSSPEARLARRRQLNLARLAERREGFWLRPDNLDVAFADPDGLGVELYRGRPNGDPAALAGECWDLEGWGSRARALEKALASSAPEATADLAPGFVLSAAVLRHLQADPLLPSSLLPPDWPGPALRSTYNDWDRRYRNILRHWGRSPQ
jgi:phenylacetic acid degradation operon negative regulatory protein